MAFLRLLAAWGIVFYHSNYPVMTHTSVAWLPFVRDQLFGWALPFFYASSAYSILSYQQSGKPWWNLWRRYATHFIILISLYQAIRIVGMNQPVFPCAAHFQCWIDVVRTGNHSIGYYLFDWLLFYLMAELFFRIRKKTGIIILFGLLLWGSLVGFNPLFNKMVSLYGLTFGMGWYLLFFKSASYTSSKKESIIRHSSYDIYLIHPFVYIVTDRLVPTLLPTSLPGVVLGIIILSTILICTGLAIGWEWCRTTRRSSV